MNFVPPRVFESAALLCAAVLAGCAPPRRSAGHDGTVAAPPDPPPPGGPDCSVSGPAIVLQRPVDLRRLAWLPAER
jgi:hypothetical protein